MPAGISGSRSRSLPYPHQNDVDEVLFNHSGYHARPFDHRAEGPD